MKNKISLRTWMFLKIAPSALLVLHYWMNVRTSSHFAIHMIVTFAVLVFFFVFAHYDNKKDLIDESAKEILKRTDSICLKTAYAIGVIAVFSVTISDRIFAVFSEVTGVIVGYYIVFSILAFTVLRAILFSVIDKRGI